MKAVIFAGGKGTRLMEETYTRPKPMVEIGGMPILWHIMKIYADQGVDEFVVCLGHKGYFIKSWFLNHRVHGSDIEIDLREDTVTMHNRRSDPWKVTLVETGEESLTATRLRIASKYLTPGETFCLTYGDGVGNVDIKASIAAHKASVARGERLATVTVVQPEGRFGAVNIEGDKAMDFWEKPQGDGHWINAGFFVLEPEALDFVPADQDLLWEHAPLRGLATSGKLGVWRHKGFWRPMDTLRDKQSLEGLWESGEAPWKTWK